MQQAIAMEVRGTLTALLGEQLGGRGNIAPEGQTQEQEPEIPPTRAVRDRRVSDVTNFLKLKPPTFCGTDPKEDPQHFLRDITRIGDILRCPSEELVDLASFQLREAARVWKETSPPVHT